MKLIDDYIAKLQNENAKTQIFKTIDDDIVALSYEIAGLGDIHG